VPSVRIVSARKEDSALIQQKSFLPSVDTAAQKELAPVRIAKLKLLNCGANGTQTNRIIAKYAVRSYAARSTVRLIPQFGQ
jgi:hypothetical protein